MVLVYYVDSKTPIVLFDYFFARYDFFENSTKGEISINIVKTMDALNENILCNHLTISYKGNFFHNHDGYELFLLLDGDINYYIEQMGIHLERGDLVLIKPYDFHRRDIVKGNTYERIVINIKDSYMDKLSTKKTDLSACFIDLPGNKSNILKLSEQQIIEYTLSAQRLSQELESGEYGSDILADTYIKQILIMANRIFNKKNHIGIINIMPSLVSNTIAYIEQHITENITLDILSNSFHHNGTYISRCFKNITGISLQQYIIRKRVTLAKKYLCEGCSPYDACVLSGFNDYSNFSRTFNKQAGISPSRFRSQNMQSRISI